MSKFPVKKFRSGVGTIEGEVVLENSLMGQVVVNGKVLVLQKTEWSEAGTGGFEDVFSTFFGGR